MLAAASAPGALDDLQRIGIEDSPMADLTSAMRRRSA